MDAPSDPFGTLARRLGGRLVRAWPLDGGVSARATGLEVETRAGLERFVARRPKAADPARTTRCEFAVLSALSGLGLRVPRPRLLDAEGELLGAPLIVLDYVDGAPARRPAEKAPLLEALGRQLAQIHASPIPDGARTLLQDREAYVARFLAEAPAQFDETIGEGEVRRVLALPRPRLRNAPTLLHGDFWPGNVLWKDGEIAAVIDWEEAAFGDPLFDLGISRLDMMWAYGTAAPQAFTDAYAAAAPHVDLSLLPWFDLIAALRPAGAISHWASITPDPVFTARRMRERLALFREQALAAYALLTR